MTNPNYTAIMLLVDRSGSMSAIRDSAEDAINEFINSQRVHDGNRRTIRISDFDDEYRSVIRTGDVFDVPPFTLVPRGMTALLDAMGEAIFEFGAELAALPEDRRPGTVIFTVMTDGMENSSREYTWTQIKEMVRHQEDVYGWQVVYLGANQDAIEVGGRLGVREDRSMTYAGTDHGTRAVYDVYSASTVAAAGGQSISFTRAQREAAAEE
jgi:hypothetical protein